MSDSFRIQICSSSDLYEKPLGLSVICRGKPYYFDTLHTSSVPVDLVIPRKLLNDGVHQVTLFTPSGEIVAERLFWVESEKGGLQLRISQNARYYMPFSPIALNMQLQGNDGTPIEGSFSFSVREQEGELLHSDAAGLRSTLLLTFDLKGYIHCPEYYFSNDSLSRKALDLLLLVQGWRRYDWKEMAGLDTFRLKHPIEDGLLVDGRVLKKIVIRHLCKV